MDPFATLGLPHRYDLDPLELEQRYRDLQKALHPDKHTGDTPAQRRIALGKAVEVNAAYRALRDELTRADALIAFLRGSSATAAVARESDRSVDPELLMTMMELRESLSEAKAQHDAAKVAQLAAQVERERAAAYAALVQAFAPLTTRTTDAQFAELSGLAARLKYCRRFLDEVRAIEEEAQAS